MFHPIFDYIVIFLFLIVSAITLTFVAKSDGRGMQKFRTKIIALYGIMGIVVLLIFAHGL
ncbi:hypothetical protein PAECIP111802_06958 [Paenibacillus allorhizosphaerae]|uniref:DUF3976 domain-containing protein n=1 Tax=Paenibacillus allorhizosphaerae TaxID=2849866 RepID=A0ABN7TW55_9BACL|nr:hypothetical protein PAECIP111802_06958 [Paenibacillus allorhizosphaerae]